MRRRFIGRGAYTRGWLHVCITFHVQQQLLIEFYMRQSFRGDQPFQGCPGHDDMRTVAGGLPLLAGAFGEEPVAFSQQRGLASAVKADNQSGLVFIPNGIGQGVGLACLEPGHQMDLSRNSMNVAGTIVAKLFEERREGGRGCGQGHVTGLRSHGDVNVGELPRLQRYIDRIREYADLNQSMAKMKARQSIVLSAVLCRMPGRLSSKRSSCIAA